MKFQLRDRNGRRARAAARARGAAAEAAVEAPEPEEPPAEDAASARDRIRQRRARAARRKTLLPAYLFILSILIPVGINIGPVYLLPYRIWLLVAFVPLLMKLLSGSSGKVLAIDILLFLSALWVAPAMLLNHPLGEAVEPIGAYMLEFFGAYLVGRVSIRNAEDFQRLVKFLYVVLLILLPFAVMEAVTHKALILDLIPRSHEVVDAGVRLGLRRVQAVFSHPIHYGVFVAGLLGLVWYVLAPKAEIGRKLRGAVFVGVSTFLSLSTGALISYLVQFGAIVWDWLTRGRKGRWRLLGILAAASYVIVDLISNRTPFHVLVTYATFNTGSAYNRILIWEHGTNNVVQNPIFGLGLQDWERPIWMVESVDNFWLLIAMRYGLPSLIFFALALFILIRRVSLVPLSDPLKQACRAGYLVTISGIIVAGGTVHYWKIILAFVMFIIGSGVWMIFAGDGTEEAGRRRLRPRPGQGMGRERGSPRQSRLRAR